MPMPKFGQTGEPGGRAIDAKCPWEWDLHKRRIWPEACAIWFKKGHN